MTDDSRRAPGVSRQALLDALIELLPTISARRELGFTPEAREDALMDVVLRLLEAEQRIPEPSTPTERVARRYASRVVHNQLVDRWRRERRLETVALAAADASTPTSSPSSPASSNAGLRALGEELVSELSDDDRRLLEAYLSDSDAFRQEVRRLGLQDGTARVRIHRLLTRLRTRAAERWGTRLSGQ